MTHVTETQAACLEGRGPERPGLAAGEPEPADHPAYLKHCRLEAAWAKAHDLAADAFGGDATQFFGPRGDALLKAMEAAPVEASAADLVAIAAEAIEKAKPKPKPKAN